MPSALRVKSFKFRVLSLLFAFIATFLTLHSTFFTQPAYACEYQQTCNVQDGSGRNGIETCTGTMQPTDSGQETCQYDQSGAVPPACYGCQPDGGPATTTPAPNQPTTSPNPGTNPPNVGTGITAPSAKDWNPVAQDIYAKDNSLCTVLVLLAGGCPYDDKKTGRTMSPDGRISLIMFDKAPGGGAIGTVSNVLASLYNPPTSSVQYLASIGRDMGLVQPVYAADTFGVPGSGAGVIEPVRQLWQAVRNIAYLAFILIFLIVGFMVMFRQKISQQAVVTAQMALPGLVVGLLLVTFSYFIAALAIDLAFLGIPLITNVIGQSGMANAFGDQTRLNEMAQNSNVFQMFSTTSGRFGETGSQLFKAIWETGNFSDTGTYMAGSAILGAIGLIIGTLIAPGPGTLIGFLAGAGGGPFAFTGIISLIVPVVLTVALFVQMFRLLFSLIGTYLQLLVGTISGPIVILASSLPGRGSGTAGWIKGLVANALVFPAVFAAFLFAGVLFAVDAKAFTNSPPLFGGLSTQLLPLLLAYGIIFATPAIPDAVRGAFGIKPQQGGIVGAALGGFMGGAQMTQTMAKTVQQRGWVGGAEKGAPPQGALADIYRGLRQRVPRLPNLRTS